MSHGDEMVRSTAARVRGAEVYYAACDFYETLLASQRELTPEALAEWVGPPVGLAVVRLLDACFDAMDR